MAQADVADFHAAVREHVLEEPAEQLENVACGGAWACTASCAGGDRDRAVREAEDALVGDGAPEDIWGEGGAGGVSMMIGLTVDVPGDGPDLWGDGRSHASVAHLFFDQSAGDGCKGFHGAREAGARGEPGRAVLGEATAGHNVVDVRMVLELSPPGMQDAGETREVCPNEARVFGQPCEGVSRGVDHGMVGEALPRAEKRAQGLRDSESNEERRSGKLCAQVALSPLLGFVMLTLRARTIATGMIAAMWPSTVLALSEAMAVVAALALLDGADGLAMHGGEVGVARKVFGRKGGEDLTQGGHGKRPCMRVLRRS
jgi:hypothetical protein